MQFGGRNYCGCWRTELIEEAADTFIQVGSARKGIYILIYPYWEYNDIIVCWAAQIKYTLIPLVLEWKDNWNS